MNLKRRLSRLEQMTPTGKLATILPTMTMDQYQAETAGLTPVELIRFHRGKQAAEHFGSATVFEQIKLLRAWTDEANEKGTQ
jgi:hypothetical protein